MAKSITEIIRGRDCITFFKGDLYTVTPSDTLMAAGWNGGTGVMWVPGVNDERTVGLSDGHYGGILIWGSDELADQYNSQTGNQVSCRYATFMSGGGLISTSSYERYTWASRQLGPLVQIIYRPNDFLYFSLRGLWTNEDEATLSGALYAPNFFTGYVAQVPKASNNGYLGIQTGL